MDNEPTLSGGSDDQPHTTDASHLSLADELKEWSGALSNARGHLSPQGQAELSDTLNRAAEALREADIRLQGRTQYCVRCENLPRLLADADLPCVDQMEPDYNGRGRCGKCANCRLDQLKGNHDHMG